MLANEGHSVNPNAYTGQNLGRTLTNLKRDSDGTTASGLYAMSGQTSSNPVYFEVKHSDIRKGKVVYQRSTIAVLRKGISAPVGDPEAVGPDGYSVVTRLIVEKPKLSGVLTDGAVCDDIGFLWSFFGTTLATSGTPNGVVGKFLQRDA